MTLSEFTCRFCGVPWDDARKRFEHMANCPIETGLFRTLGHKRKPKVAPVKVEQSWLDEPKPEDHQ